MGYCIFRRETAYELRRSLVGSEMCRRDRTAHHGMLQVNITDQERMAPVAVEAPTADDAAELQQLWELQQALAGEPGNLLERFSAVTAAWQDIHHRYVWLLYASDAAGYQPFDDSS